MTAATSTRRGLLGGSAALLAGTALPSAGVAAAGAGAGPDAELLALIADFHATHKASDDLLRPMDDLPSSDPRSKAAWAHHCDILSPRWHELKWAIATTPARTREGLAAKALCALDQLTADLDGVPAGDDALNMSVLHDVLGLPAVQRGED